jgi:PKHD-type hydroxylase
VAFQAVWYDTKMPEELINQLNIDVRETGTREIGTLTGANATDTKQRNSWVTWVPTSNWIAGYVWWYIQRANRENFQYDLGGFDGEALQYTEYDKSQHYYWHTDGGLDTAHQVQSREQSYKSISDSQYATTEQFKDSLILKTEKARKLSFSLLLTDPGEYEGGELQFNSCGGSFYSPQERGTIVIFDSRISHRVKKIRSGTRKSLVGWVIGPRWR